MWSPKRWFGYSDVLAIGAAHIDSIVDSRRQLFYPDEPGQSGTPYRYGTGSIVQSVGGGV